MRYFLFTISSQNGNVSIVENLGLEYNRFPSVEDIKKHANGKNIAITNIFEFKSKEDYESFTSKS